MAYDGVVAQYRVLFLQQIINTQNDQSGTQKKYEQARMKCHPSKQRQ